jgi:patatin-like phospholipase/acyl hydrolase
MLEAIERRCFGIPVLHLFDLVVGTSSGGQIALALTTPTPFEPLTVAAAMTKFRELMKASFTNTRSPIILAALNRILRKNKYKYRAGPLESQLKDLFGEDTRLFSAATSSRSRVPNTAVTTVADQSFQPYLIAN